VITRRVALAAAATVAAGGIGAAAGMLRSRSPQGRPAPPSWLVAAAERERHLLDGIDTALAAAPHAAVLAAVRADHAAHADALTQLIADYPDSAASRSPRAPPPAVATTPRSTSSSAALGANALAQLRAAEQSAAQTAAAAASQLAGADAALFASIAACEGSHVEVLR
jgi:hypothetical protein